MVESQPSKLLVASSILVSRSILDNAQERCIPFFRLALQQTQPGNAGALN